MPRPTSRPSPAASRRLRPLLEACEARTLLSTTPIRIGTLGDSVTDEYQFYGPDRTAARNWPEILSALRGSDVSFGAFTTSDRGETRNQGYAQNWARSGAQATPGQPDVSGANTYFVQQYQGGFTPGSPGLITQPGGLSNVDVVTILIGTNDFRNALQTALTNPQSTNVPANVFANLLNATSGVVQGVTDAVNALQAARPNIPIVLAVTPNITNTALFEELTAILPPADVHLLDGLIDGLINDIKTQFQALAGPTIAVFDPNEIFARFIQNGDKIQGLYIDPVIGGPVITNLFVGDSFHPGTIGQGLLANGFLAAIDQVVTTADITPLSDAEIVALALQSQPVSVATITPSAPVMSTGSAISFTVQVEVFATPIGTPGPGAFPVPTGTVTFFDASAGNALLGVATLDTTGRATFTTTTLPTGGHKIVASYSGDTVYPPTTTTAASVVIGTQRQAALINLVELYRERLGQQVSLPLLNRWTRWLDRGFRPETIARTIYHRVGQMPVPRPMRPRLVRAEAPRVVR